MRHIQDGPFNSFPVCDFCDIDSSGGNGRVRPIGQKGICDKCLRSLKALLTENEKI